MREHYSLLTRWCHSNRAGPPDIAGVNLDRPAVTVTFNQRGEERGALRLAKEQTILQPFAPWAACSEPCR